MRDDRILPYRNKSNRARGFTLIEMLVASILFAIVVGIVFQSYIQFVQRRNVLYAQQYLVESSHTFVESLHERIKQLSVDYEEYFARRLVGCDTVGDVHSVGSFSWDVGENGKCDLFTWYGNRSSLLSPLTDDRNHHLYHCSTSIDTTRLSPYYIVAVPRSDITSFRDGSGCFLYRTLGGGDAGFISYGQYAREFIDVQNTVDNDVSDKDDIDVGRGPVAFSVGTGLQELYLINADENRRFLLRRSLVDTVDINKDGVFDDIYERRYTLQLLELSGIDAGFAHDMGRNSMSAYTNDMYDGLYDGVIDTWVCAISQGFYCGDSTSDRIVDTRDSFVALVPGDPLYEQYVMPLHTDDGRIDLLNDKLTVVDWSISISPRRDPSLAWDMEESHVQPHVHIAMNIGLYGKHRSRTVPLSFLKNYTMPLQTSFALGGKYD